MNGDSSTTTGQLRQPYLPHQLSKARVGMQRVECEVSLQLRQQPIALLIGGVEPLEGVILVSQIGIQGSNLVGGRVARLALRLPDFNAFGESAFSAR
jgi:hypothetical protein